MALHGLTKTPSSTKTCRLLANAVMIILIIQFHMMVCDARNIPQRISRKASAPQRHSRCVKIPHLHGETPPTSNERDATPGRKLSERELTCVYHIDDLQELYGRSDLHGDSHGVATSFENLVCVSISSRFIIINLIKLNIEQIK